MMRRHLMGGMISTLLLPPLLLLLQSPTLLQVVVVCVPSSSFSSPLSPTQFSQFRPDAEVFTPGMLQGGYCCNGGDTSDMQQMPPNMPTDEQLEQFLLDQRIMQTSAERTTIKNIVKRLTGHLREKVDEGIECHASGSQYMDAALSNRTEFGSDLDIVCTVPVLKRRNELMSDFYEALKAAKKENPSIDISEERSKAIRYSGVPTIKLHYKLPDSTSGEKTSFSQSTKPQEVVEVDIAFARVKPTEEIPPKEPETEFVDWLLDDEKVYAAVDFAKPNALDKEKSKEERVRDKDALVDYTTLNGLRNLADLRRTAEKCRFWKTFRLAVLVNKWWTKLMGISDHIYGFPPPLAWMLTMFVTMRRKFLPGKSATEMVVHLHQIKWKWFLGVRSRESIQAEMTQLKEGGKAGKLPDRDDGPVVVKLPYDTTLKNPPLLLKNEVWEPMKEIVGGGLSMMGAISVTYPQKDTAMNVWEPQLLYTQKYIKDGGTNYLSPNSGHMFTYEELPDDEEDGGGKKKKKLTNFPLFKQKPAFVHNNSYFVVVVVESESVERHSVVAQYASSKIHELTKRMAREHSVSAQGLRITPYPKRFDFPQPPRREKKEKEDQEDEHLYKLDDWRSGSDAIKVDTRRSSFFLFALHPGQHENNIILDTGDSLGDFANTVNSVEGGGGSGMRTTVRAFCYDTGNDLETLQKLVPRPKSCITEPVVEMIHSNANMLSRLANRMPKTPSEAKEREAKLTELTKKLRELYKLVERKLTELVELTLNLRSTNSVNLRSTNLPLTTSSEGPSIAKLKQKETRKITDAKEYLAKAIARAEHYKQPLQIFTAFPPLEEAKLRFIEAISDKNFDTASTKEKEQLGSKLEAAQKVYDYFSEGSTALTAGPWNKDENLQENYTKLGTLIAEVKLLHKDAIPDLVLIRNSISLLETGLAVSNYDWDNPKTPMKLSDAINIGKANKPYNAKARDNLRSLLETVGLSQEERKDRQSLIASIQKMNARLDVIIKDNTMHAVVPADGGGGGKDAGKGSNTASKKTSSSAKSSGRTKKPPPPPPRPTLFLQELVAKLDSVKYFSARAMNDLKSEVGNAKRALADLEKKYSELKKKDADAIDKHAKLKEDVRGPLEEIDKLIKRISNTYDELKAAPKVLNSAQTAWNALEKAMQPSARTKRTDGEELECWSEEVMGEKFDKVREVHSENESVFTANANVYAAIGSHPSAVLDDLADEAKAFAVVLALIEKELKAAELMVRVKKQSKKQMVDNDLCKEIDAEQKAVAELAKGFADKDTKPAYSKVVARHSALVADNLASVLFTMLTHNGDYMKVVLDESMEELRTEDFELKEAIMADESPDNLEMLESLLKLRLGRAKAIRKEVERQRAKTPPRLVKQEVENDFTRTYEQHFDALNKLAKEKYDPLCEVIREKSKDFKKAAEKRIRAFNKAIESASGEKAKDQLGPTKFTLTYNEMRIHAQLQLAQSRPMREQLYAEWTIWFKARPSTSLEGERASDEKKKCAESELNLALQMYDYIVRNQEGTYRTRWSKDQLFLIDTLSKNELDMTVAAERRLRLYTEVLEPGFKQLTQPSTNIDKQSTFYTYCSRDFFELTRLAAAANGHEAEPRWVLDEKFCLRSFLPYDGNKKEMEKELKLVRVPVEFVEAAASDDPLGVKVKPVIKSESELLEVVEMAVKCEKDKGKIRKVLVHVAKSVLGIDGTGEVPYYLVVYSPASKRAALRLMQRVLDQQLFIHFITHQETTTAGEEKVFLPSQATFEEIAKALESGDLDPKSIAFARPYAVETATIDKAEESSLSNNNSNSSNEPEYLYWSKRMDLASNRFIQTLYSMLLAAGGGSHSVSRRVFDESRSAGGWMLRSYENVVIRVSSNSPDNDEEVGVKANFPITVVNTGQGTTPLASAVRVSYLVSGRDRAEEILRLLDDEATTLRSSEIPHPLAWNIERAFAVRVEMTKDGSLENVEKEEDGSDGVQRMSSSSGDDEDEASSPASSTTLVADDSELYEIVLADYRASADVNGGGGDVFSLDAWRKIFDIASRFPDGDLEGALRMVVDPSERHSVRRRVPIALDETLLETYIVDEYSPLDGESSAAGGQVRRSYLIAAFPLHNGNHILQPHGTNGQINPPATATNNHSLQKINFALAFIGNATTERTTIDGRDRVEELLAREDFIRLHDSVLFPYLLPTTTAEAETRSKMVQAIKKLAEMVSSFLVAFAAFRPKLHEMEDTETKWLPQYVDLEISQKYFYIHLYPQSFDEWSMVGIANVRLNTVHPNPSSVKPNTIENRGYSKLRYLGAQLFPMHYWVVFRKSNVITDEEVLFRQVKLGTLDQIEAILESYRLRHRALYDEKSGAAVAVANGHGGGRDAKQEEAGASGAAKKSRSSRKSASRRNRKSQATNQLQAAAVLGSTDAVLSLTTADGQEKTNAQLVADAMKEANNEQFVKFLLYNPDKGENTTWSVAEAILIKTTRISVAVHFMLRLGAAASSKSTRIHLRGNTAAIDVEKIVEEAGKESEGLSSLIDAPLHMIYGGQDQNGYNTILQALTKEKDVEKLRTVLWPENSPNVGFLAVFQLAKQPDNLSTSEDKQMTADELTQRLTAEESVYRRVPLGDNPRRVANRFAVELDRQVKLSHFPIMNYLQGMPWKHYEGRIVFVEKMMIQGYLFKPTLVYNLTFVYVARSVEEVNQVNSKWAKVMKKELEHEALLVENKIAYRSDDNRWVLKNVHAVEIEKFSEMPGGDKLVFIACAFISSDDHTHRTTKMLKNLKKFGDILLAYGNINQRITQLGEMTRGGHQILHKLEDIDKIVAAAPLVYD